MARRSRSRTIRRAPAGERELIWTSLLGDVGTVSTTPLGFDIVEPIDWERSSVAQESATLVRIRGWLSFAHIVVNSSYYALIVKLNSARGSPNPSSAAAYSDEQILWSYTHVGGSTLDNASVSVSIDVKAQRKISSSDDIRFVEVATVASSIQSGYLLRGLVTVK